MARVRADAEGDIVTETPVPQFLVDEIARKYGRNIADMAFPKRVPMILGPTPKPTTYSGKEPTPAPILQAIETERQRVDRIQRAARAAQREGRA